MYLLCEKCIACGPTNHSFLNEHSQVVPPSRSSCQTGAHVRWPLQYRVSQAAVCRYCGTSHDLSVLKHFQVLSICSTPLGGNTMPLLLAPPTRRSTPVKRLFPSHATPLWKYLQNQLARLLLPGFGTIPSRFNMERGLSFCYGAPIPDAADNEQSQ
jgi:hypothetical protein